MAAEEPTFWRFKGTLTSFIPAGRSILHEGVRKRARKEATGRRLTYIETSHSAPLEVGVGAGGSGQSLATLEERESERESGTSGTQRQEGEGSETT
jgi:hypothetical protein